MFHVEGLVWPETCFRSCECPWGWRVLPIGVEPPILGWERVGGAGDIGWDIGNAVGWVVVLAVRIGRLAGGWDGWAGQWSVVLAVVVVWWCGGWDGWDGWAGQYRWCTAVCSGAAVVLQWYCTATLGMVNLKQGFFDVVLGCQAGVSYQLDTIRGYSLFRATYSAVVLFYLSVLATVPTVLCVCIRMFAMITLGSMYSLAHCHSP